MPVATAASKVAAVGDRARVDGSGAGATWPEAVAVAGMRTLMARAEEESVVVLRAEAPERE